MGKLSMSHVLGIALAEKGYKESPPNSNRTKYGAWYPMNGSAWCAMYVSWCFREDLAMLKGKFARTDTKASALNKAGLFHVGTSGMKKGDVVFFAFNGSGYQGRYRGIHHVGIVLGKLADGRFSAVEGNTSQSSSDNGGEVQIRYRAASGIAGYYRPDYSGVAAPSKPSAPSNPSTTPTLQLGSENTLAVTKLQKELNQSGAKLVVDGDFGANTLVAVKAFQSKYKLEADGIVGPATWKVLLATGAPAASVVKIKTVTARSGLRVRSGAGLNYRVLGTLKYGSKVSVVSSSSGWYKIKFNNGYGYVSSSYVK